MPDSEMFKFVSALFEAGRDPRARGIVIPMADGTQCCVSLEEREGAVHVLMNNINMGRFEPWGMQEYKYAFYQKNRIGMRKGLTDNEIMLMSICERNPYIKLIRAVN